MATTLVPRPVEQGMALPIGAATGVGRLVSVDALRGFDMLWIVGAGGVVRALGAMKPNEATKFFTTQLQHVGWEGFRFYDLIFPLFLFIVGVSLVFSLDKALAQGGYLRAIGRIARRAVLLYALGVLYSGGLTQPWPNVPLAGVLQRIAACYLAAALIYCLVRRSSGIAAVCAALLLGYWALLALVPFPDLKLEKPAVEKIARRIGSHEPGAIAAAVPERVHGVYEEGRNLTNYVDFRFLPGRKTNLYYINEGLLSTLPAIALPLFGILAGLLLKRLDLSPRQKMLRLLAAGIVGVVAGLAWGETFPIIKRIWTSSFVVLAGGLSAVVLAVFYELVDVRRWRTWCQPLVWVGSNAITIYLAAQFINFHNLAARLVGGDVKQTLDTHVAAGMGELVAAIVSLVLVVLLARFLYKRAIFLRV